MEELNENQVQELVPNKRKKKDLTSLQRQQVVKEMIERCENHGGSMVPMRGTYSAVAKIFDLHHSSVKNIWIIAKYNASNPAIMAYTASSRKT